MHPKCSEGRSLVGRWRLSAATLPCTQPLRVSVLTHELHPTSTCHVLISQGEAAAAINWVLKDGAGRLGRFLFARWGRELDCELKQFRLAGDLLMEAGEGSQ